MDGRKVCRDASLVIVLRLHHELKLLFLAEGFPSV